MPITYDTPVGRFERTSLGQFFKLHFRKKHAVEEKVGVVDELEPYAIALSNQPLDGAEAKTYSCVAAAAAGDSENNYRLSFQPDSAQPESKSAQQPQRHILVIKNLADAHIVSALKFYIKNKSSIETVLLDPAITDIPDFIAITMSDHLLKSSQVASVKRLGWYAVAEHGNAQEIYFRNYSGAIEYFNGQLNFRAQGVYTLTIPNTENVVILRDRCFNVNPEGQLQSRDYLNYIQASDILLCDTLAIPKKGFYNVAIERVIFTQRCKSIGAKGFEFSPSYLDSTNFLRGPVDLSGIETVGLNAFARSGITECRLGSTRIYGKAFKATKQLQCVTCSEGLVELVGNGQFQESGIQHFDAEQADLAVLKNKRKNKNGQTKYTVNRHMVSSNFMSRCKSLEAFSYGGKELQVSMRAFSYCCKLRRFEACVVVANKEAFYDCPLVKFSRTRLSVIGPRAFALKDEENIPKKARGWVFETVQEPYYRRVYGLNPDSAVTIDAFGNRRYVVLEIGGTGADGSQIDFLESRTNERDVKKLFPKEWIILDKSYGLTFNRPFYTHGCPQIVLAMVVTKSLSWTRGLLQCMAESGTNEPSHFINQMLNIACRHCVTPSALMKVFPHYLFLPDVQEQEEQELTTIEPDQDVMRVLAKIPLQDIVIHFATDLLKPKSCIEALLQRAQKIDHPDLDTRAKAMRTKIFLRGRFEFLMIRVLLTLPIRRSWRGFEGLYRGNKAVYNLIKAEYRGYNLHDSCLDIFGRHSDVGSWRRNLLTQELAQIDAEPKAALVAASAPNAATKTNTNSGAKFLDILPTFIDWLHGDRVNKLHKICNRMLFRIPDIARFNYVQLVGMEINGQYRGHPTIFP